MDTKIYGKGTLWNDNGEKILDGVDCCITIPPYELGVICIIISKIHFLNFINGKYRLEITQGNVVYQIRPLLIEQKTSQIDAKFFDVYLVADGMLQVERLPNDHLESQEQIDEIIYYLSPYNGIPMAYIHKSDYLGCVECKFVNADFLKFHLPGFGEIQFEKLFSNQSLTDVFSKDTMIGFPTCRVTLDNPIIFGISEEVMNKLKQEVNPVVDFVLSIISFMNERRVAWYKCQINTGFKLYTVYKHTAGLSTYERGKDRQECIPVCYFSEFLQNAINVLRDSPYRYRMKVAFDTIAMQNTNEINISSEMYLSLFSAMESLLLIYRRLNKKEHIINEKAWKKLHHNLHTVINQCSNLSDAQKNGMTAKLAELNRYSLREVYDQFVVERKLDIEYLWPVFAKSSDKPGLSDLRNQLIHGENANLISLYMYAQDHVQLLLERMICNLLDWPLEKTNISNRILLHNYIAVRDLSLIREDVKAKYKQIHEQINRKL